MFATFDGVLIDRLFQPLCDFMHERFALTCCAAACFCLDVALIAWIMARLPVLSGTMAAWAGAMFSELATLLLGLVALVALRIMFRRVLGLHCVNPLRLAMRSHHAVILLLLVSRLMQRLSPTFCNAADMAVLAFAAIALYPPDARPYAVIGLCTPMFRSVKPHASVEASNRQSTHRRQRRRT